VALCGKREIIKRKRIQPPAEIEAPLTSIPIKLEPELEPEPELDLFPLLMGPTQCPGCVGDERQTKQERTFLYCRPTKRNDHFDDQHLKEIERAKEHGKLIKCGHPKCREREVYLPARRNTSYAYRHETSCLRKRRILNEPVSCSTDCISINSILEARREWQLLLCQV
jgi:hypothetical protein